MRGHAFMDTILIHANTSKHAIPFDLHSARRRQRYFIEKVVDDSLWHDVTVKTTQ